MDFILAIFVLAMPIFVWRYYVEKLTDKPWYHRHFLGAAAGVFSFVVLLPIAMFISPAEEAEQEDRIAPLITESQPVINLTPRLDVAKWHEGGTLGNSSALDWQQATYENKLATSADLWAALWLKKPEKLSGEVFSSIQSMDDLRPWADALVEELDVAFAEEPDSDNNRRMFTNQKVSDTAVLIMVINGWVEI